MEHRRDQPVAGDLDRAMRKAGSAVHGRFWHRGSVSPASSRSLRKPVAEWGAKSVKQDAAPLPSTNAFSRSGSGNRLQMRPSGYLWPRLACRCAPDVRCPPGSLPLPSPIKGQPLWPEFSLMMIFRKRIEAVDPAGRCQTRNELPELNSSSERPILEKLQINQ